MLVARVAPLLLSVVLVGVTLRTAVAAPAPLPPPFIGAYQPQGVDEIGMWENADQSERLLAVSPLLVRDEKLTAYVRGVLCSAVGSDRCSSVRLYIIRDPNFNASMAPNGTMRVYTGLLLRMNNESELASVLGHEFGHFELRHGLGKFKSQRTTTDILAWGAVLAGIAANNGVSTNYSSIEYSVYGDFFRYSRSLEREADLLSLGYLNSGSLRPQAAANVWINLMGEAEASARMRGVKKPNFNAVAFFASHPPEAERAVYLADYADPGASLRDDGKERYREALATWLPTFLDDQIKVNDFGATEYVLDQLAVDGWTAVLLNARGDLYRRRGHPRDLVNAAEFYGEAAALDPTLAAAHRGLGLSLIKTGRASEGQVALKKYLTLNPDAQDSKMIRLMLPKEN